MQHVAAGTYRKSDGLLVSMVTGRRLGVEPHLGPGSPAGREPALHHQLIGASDLLNRGNLRPPAWPRQRRLELRLCGRLPPVSMAIRLSL